MRREPIGTGRLPLRVVNLHLLKSSIGVDFPIPEKPTSPVREVAGLVSGIAVT